MGICPSCGERDCAEGKRTCYRCHLKGVGFTFRGAHLGRAGWNESTVEAEKRDLFAHAKLHGLEIERKR